MSNTHEEGMYDTCTGVDGECPVALDLGTRGQGLGLRIRAGNPHSACACGYNIERALCSACAGSAAPLVLHAETVFCSPQLLVQALRLSLSSMC